jgi:hypothetical protein
MKNDRVSENAKKRRIGLNRESLRRISLDANELRQVQGGLNTAPTTSLSYAPKDTCGE